MIFLVLAPAANSLSNERLQVAASIAPLHSLVSGVTHGVNETVLIVPAGESPHEFSMKPSQMKKITEAKAVFFVSKGLETFLHNPLRSLPAGVAKAEVAEISGITLLKNSTGQNDPHVWLSPKNAEKIVRTAAKWMARINPRQRNVYKKNARETIKKLKKLDATIRKEVAGVSDIPYAVFHDAYRYFESEYSMNGIGSITENPEIPQSAAGLKHIRAKIRESGAVCVFSEPQYSEKRMRAAAEGSGARTAFLDPLGVGIEPGPNLYFEMMENLARSLKNCLSN